MSILGQTQSKRAKVHHAVPKIHKALSAFSSASSDSHSHASRILLYQEFQFHESGNLIGVKTLDYGLEKSRVVSVPSGEANFDIFYVLLSGASREEKAEWHLHDASHYHYLSASHFIPALHDLDLSGIRQALKASGVGSRYQQQVFKLLSAILHLGNLQFHYDADNNDESCSVKNRDLLDIISDLLGVSCSNLEFALTYKSRIIQNELCTVFLSVEEAV